jgi:NDP-sugar pyrophosphorylase family protein
MLIDEGIGEFIIFSYAFKKSQEFQNELFKNGVSATFLDLNRKIGTYDALNLIKGSINDTFLLVYSCEVCKFDLNDAHFYHKSSDNVATLLTNNRITAGIFLDSGITDYMIEPCHFERVLLKRIFEDGEAGVYNILAYELY